MSKFDAYMEKTEAQLEEWSADIAKLRARGKKARADLKIRYYNEVEELEKLRRKAEFQLRELAGSGEKEFEKLRSKVDAAMTDLKNAVDQIRKGTQDTPQETVPGTMKVRTEE